MFFDSHAHYDDERFENDRSEVIKSVYDNKITRVCNVGSDIETSKKSIALAEKYDFIYAAVGVHPHEVENMTDETLGIVSEMTKNKKVVAIGEIGLDYYYDNSPRDLQKKWFEAQLDMAKKLDMPCIIHTRDATEDTLSILKNVSAKDVVIHCYSGSKETAKTILNMGYYISFAGTVTFKNARGILDVVKYVPDDRFFIETDCPYLTPEPNRGKRNYSVYMIDTAKKIAEIRDTTLSHIAEVTYNNASKFYRIK